MLATPPNSIIKTIQTYIFGHLYFTGPFKETKAGYKYILVCIDLLTNWVEAQPPTTIEAIEVCQAFYKLVI